MSRDTFLWLTGTVEHVVLLSSKNKVTRKIQASDQDIRKSIDTQLNKIVLVVSEAMQDDPTLRSSILDAIITKARGMYYYPLFYHFADEIRFLLASLYLKFLERQRNKHLIWSALGELSTDLIETYKNAISRIQAEPEQRDIKIALKTLMWITFAREPLQAEPLLEALVVSEGESDIKESHLEDIQKVVSLCVGLASVDSKGGEIRLVHETAKEYLQKYFRDGQEDGNAEIADTCLRYLSFPAFSSIFEDKMSLEDHLKKYKLSSYASRYWFVHIREGVIEKKFIRAILDTFKNPDTRNSVFQIAEYVKNPWFFNYKNCKIFILRTL
jgi:ankyrin repeat domain-containing protein 50